MRALVGLVVLAALAAGCGSAAPAPEAAPTRTPPLQSVIRIEGEVVVTDPRTIRYTPGYRSCVTRGASRDIHTGTAVTVRNPDGVRIAAGTLLEGRMRTSSRTKPVGCVFTFDMSNAPGGRAAYTVAVGRRSPHRVVAADLTRVVIEVPTT